MVVACFAARVPPAPDRPARVEVCPISVGVVVPSRHPRYPDWDLETAETLASDLNATELFKSVSVLDDAADATDVRVELVEWKRGDPDSYCYESFVYSGFSLFVIPGCAHRLGYKLRFTAPGDPEPIDFDFEYDELWISGWVALPLLPLAGWQLPPKDRIRLSEHLAAQLTPLVPELEAISGSRFR